MKSMPGADAPLDVRTRTLFRRLSYFWLAILLANLGLAWAYPGWRSWGPASLALVAVSGILFGFGMLRPGNDGRTRRIAARASLVLGSLAFAAAVAGMAMLVWQHQERIQEPSSATEPKPPA